MKFLVFSLMVLLVGSAAVAAPKILNWTSTEVSESDAITSVEMGVKSVLENSNSCELVSVWGLEAINHLKDYYGNPLIVVNSIAEVRGSRCELAKHQDCSTVFVKEDGYWKYDDTTCDTEEAAE